MTDSTDFKESNERVKALHPILVINHGGDKEPDEEDFTNSFRPRANTDPTSPRPRFRVHFDLPDIVVDDCSDNDDSLVDDSNRELANTAEGAFFVFTSPPRQRSNTCPMNMFSRRKLNRPPTPPPNDVKSRDTMVRHSSKDKVSFSPHKLSKVSEDGSLDGSRTGTTSERKHSTPKVLPQRKSSNPTSSSSPSVTSSLEARKSRATGKNIGRSTINSDSPNSSPKRSPNKGQHNNGHAQRGSTTGHLTRDVIHTTA